VRARRGRNPRDPRTDGDVPAALAVLMGVVRRGRAQWSWFFSGGHATASCGRIPTVVRTCRIMMQDSYGDGCHFHLRWSCI
jgi:hypothetical protein